MRFAVLIPALNEEFTVGAVVRACLESRYLDEVIVISDGSCDRTAEVARASGAHKVIELPQNRGKDYALKVGAHSTEAEYLVLLDADLIGLKPEHIEALVLPIIKREAETTLGLFKKGDFRTELAQVVTPFLSGQRVISKKTWEEAILPEATVGFGLEIVLQRYIKAQGLALNKVYLHGLSHRMKEEKLGLKRGFLSRMRMYLQILKAVFRKNSVTKRP